MYSYMNVCVEGNYMHPMNLSELYGLLTMKE